MTSGFRRLRGTCSGSDGQFSLELADGHDFIRAQPHGSFDLVFADAWADKYVGSMTRWRCSGTVASSSATTYRRKPIGRTITRNADRLVAYLEGLDGWTTVTLCWGSGFVIAVRL